MELRASPKLAELCCRRLTFEQAHYQCRTTLGRPALHFFWPLFFCHWPTSRVSSTLYYGWLHFQGEQDTVLPAISKRGDRYLRSLLIHGARSALYYAACRHSRRSEWLG